MELTQSHIKELKDAFLSMETREHLLEVLNFAKPFVYGDKAVPFELKQLTYYSRQNSKHYHEFKLEKKSGGYRTINAPYNGLKAVQKTLAFVLQCVFEPHNAATGFVKEKSIVDNAKAHVGNHYVYNIDLKDFFSSIDQARVWKCLQLKPFLLNSEHITGLKTSSNSKSYVTQFTTDFGEEIVVKIIGSTAYFLNDKKGGFIRFKKRILDQLDEERAKNPDFSVLDNDEYFDKEVLGELIKKYLVSDEKLNTIKFVKSFSRKDLAGFIANICCTKMTVSRKDDDGTWVEMKKNVLPQGAPTSPVLTNVVCQRLDYLLSGVAKRFGLRYTRYADDITFSSLHNVYQEDSPFLKEMRRVIEDQGFIINERKTRLQVDGIRKEVTGLVVNEKVNLKKRYVKQLRMWIYYCEKYGYYKAQSLFARDYNRDKGHIKSAPRMLDVINGKLDYLKMVKGPQNSTYLKLKERWDEVRPATNEMDALLDVWEEQGIEKAMADFSFKLQVAGG
ncbi:reverse transcriptase domain-containing protein [Gilvibacter sp.]|uniref:reverse transcriptase domain-containing protein n=1 Tax=Gilvibacter sp. TaxID=2729997 RepID=UPI003B52C559